MMEVEKLIDIVAVELANDECKVVATAHNYRCARVAVRTILSEIKNGGVVEACDCVFNLGEDCKECDGDGFILKPEFEKFLNEK